MNKKHSYNTCPSGKNPYETEEDVKFAVRESWLLRDKKLSYYLCLHCFKYHLTSNLKSKK